MMTKNVKRGRVLGAVAGLICGMATLQAALVYNNPLSDPTYAGPLYVTADTEVLGSQIILDLTGNPGFTPYKFKFYYYLINDVVNQRHVVSAQVKFLQNDGGSSEPNTPIWASDVFAIPFTGEFPSDFLFVNVLAWRWRDNPMAGLRWASTTQATGTHRTVLLLGRT